MISKNLFNLDKTKRNGNVRLRGIALPNEHGSWSILLEPLVGAGAVAFTPATIWISMLFIGAFLMRQPLRIWLADRNAGRDLPQTWAARKYTLVYSAIFAAGLVGTIAIVPAANFLPLAIAAPLCIVQIYYDMRHKSRSLIPELTGAVALSSSAALISLAGGWTMPAAASLWAIFILRLIPSVLYIRNRLRLEKGKSWSAVVPIVGHLIALLAVAVLAFVGFSPIMPVVMFGILLGRAAFGLSPYRKKRKAMQIGIFEVIFGTLTVLSVIVGYRLHM